MYSNFNVLTNYNHPNYKRYFSVYDKIYMSCYEASDIFIHFVSDYGKD